jgi:hypothetical protein
MHSTSCTFPTLGHLDRLSANGNTTAAAHGVTVPKYFVAAAACHAASCCVSVRPRARFLLATRHVKTGALKLRHVFSCNCAATSCTIFCFLETALPRGWKRGEASCDYLKSRPGSRTRPHHSTPLIPGIVKPETCIPRASCLVSEPADGLT